MTFLKAPMSLWPDRKDPQIHQCSALAAAIPQMPMGELGL
jgi:hypothetical protein